MKTKKRTDDSYIELDNAICCLQQFSREIRWMLCKSARNERALDDVLEAMQTLHDGELDKAPL